MCGWSIYLEESVWSSLCLLAFLSQNTALSFGTAKLDSEPSLPLIIHAKHFFGPSDVLSLIS